MTIGQVAKRCGLGVEAIRFYEREGLIPDPPRRTSGYREYSQETVARIHFIRRAKELGFSLKEIRELLTLRVDPETTCSDIKVRAQDKLRDIDAKMRSLRQIKRALQRLTAKCEDTIGPTGECPILEALGTSTPLQSASTARR